MKKLKVFIVLGVLVFGMSSCVYSLFPIYTEDTVVFLPELIGKWQNDPEYPDEYLEFQPYSEKRKRDLGLITQSESTISINEDSDGDKSTAQYTMSGDGWSIRSDDPITVEIEGKEYSDPEVVRAYYDGLFGEMQQEASEKTSKFIDNTLQQAIDSAGNIREQLAPKLEKLGEGLEKLSKGLGRLSEGLSKVDANFKGSVSYSGYDTYKLIEVDGDERNEYKAHVAQIGEDYFLDIYPINNNASENYFPVHSFFKIGFEDGQLKLTLFRLGKLNELFESNLIRLRHEYVDGSVLITAQPKEIQKFLDNYSDDESVFEEPGFFKRIE